MFHTIIYTNHGNSWFSGLMIFTLILVNSVFIYRGLKQKRPLDSLLLITAAGILFFLIGVSLFPLDGQDILTVIRQGNPSSVGEKSVIGGLLGLLIRMVYIALLREKMRLIDNIAVVFLLGLGLQNLGCYMAGCCYGEPSTGFWTVQYGTGSPAFQSHLYSGLIASDENRSLSVYPVQLFLLLACLLASFIAWKMQARWKAPLSAFLFSMILSLLARFSVEFLRDPLTNHGAGQFILGIKQIQWVLMFLLILFVPVLYLREKHWKPRLTSEVNSAGLPVKIGLGLFLILVNWWFQGLFEFAGKLVIDFALLSTCLVLAWNVFRRFTLPAYRVATLCSLSGACILMSQSYIPQNKEEKTSYTEIGGGVQYSSYYNTISTNLGKSTGCSGSYYRTGNPHSVRYEALTAGGTWSKTEILGEYKRAHYGFNFYGGNDWEKGVDTSLRRTLPIFGLEPFVGFDGRWVGFSAGLHLGNFHYADMVTKSTSDNVGDIVGDVDNKYVFPSLSFRAGPYDVFYLEAFLSDYFPSSSPVMLYGMAMGTGFGKTDGRSLKVGGSTSGYFSQLYYPIRQNYFLNASLGYRPKSHYGEDNSRTMMSLGLSYRFNYKTIQKSSTKN